MKNREGILGAVVLAVMLAGFFWTRSHSHDGGVAVSNRPTPDVTFADAHVDVGGVRVLLSVTPRPAVALAKARFRVRAESSGAPAQIDDGRISFAMAMPMGDHRNALGSGQDGWQQAEVVLPICSSGDSRWYAVVDGTVAGRSVSARFQIDLARPGSAPAP